VAFVELRPMVRADLSMLLTWLGQPHVSEWWRDQLTDLAGVEDEYGACIDGDDPTELFVIEAAAGPIGMIQRYLFADEPEWTATFDDIADVTRAAGIDFLIGEPAAVGCGLGTAAIQAFTRLVFEWRPVRSIIVPVQQANPASWRVLEKAGFVRIWSGELDSPDASDSGPAHVYLLERPD
jgi:aminoglycoside 6'-N-acetyltransferase